MYLQFFSQRNQHVAVDFPSVQVLRISHGALGCWCWNAKAVAEAGCWLPPAKSDLFRSIFWDTETWLWFKDSWNMLKLIFWPWLWLKDVDTFLGKRSGHYRYRPSSIWRRHWSRFHRCQYRSHAQMSAARVRRWPSEMRCLKDQA